MPPYLHAGVPRATPAPVTIVSVLIDYRKDRTRRRKAAPPEWLFS